MLGVLQTSEIVAISRRDLIVIVRPEQIGVAARKCVRREHVGKVLCPQAMTCTIVRRGRLPCRDDFEQEMFAAQTKSGAVGPDARRRTVKVVQRDH